jgi:hypothetical protein
MDKTTEKLKFERFTIEAGWTNYDCLGKRRLENNEWLMLQWPDKTTEKVKVDLRKTTKIVDEMGRPAEVHYFTAYTKINHCGSILDIRLTSIKYLKAASLNRFDPY